MAERRMFAKTIIDSDAFLEMPSTSQLLYFHLSIRADDEGFINKPKTIMRMIGAKDDDMNVLIARKFIIPFESGVVVIKHWRIHNYLQNDRLVETKYKDEKEMLELDENKAYRIKKVECIQNTGEVYTQVRLGKVSIGKVSLDQDRKESSENVEMKIFQQVEQEFKRPLSSNEIDKISYWVDLKGERYFYHALREASMYGKLSVSYIDKILLNWDKIGYTVEQLDEGVQALDSAYVKG